MLSTSSNAPVSDNSTTKHFRGGALPHSIVAAARPFSRGARRFSGGRRPNGGMGAIHTRTSFAQIRASEPTPFTHCYWSDEPSAEEAEEQQENDHRERHAEEPEEDRHDGISFVDGRIGKPPAQVQVPWEVGPDGKMQTGAVVAIL